MVWVKRVLGAIALLVASIWAGYLAAFNWWAAGGPPTPYPRLYELRGNLFGIAAVLLLVAFVVVVVRNIRRLLRPRVALTGDGHAGLSGGATQS